MTSPVPDSHDLTLCLSRSLFDILDEVSDPRHKKGQRHSLQALLSLLVLSFVTGGETVKDAVLLGRTRPHLRPALGFSHRLCPSQSTYTRLFHVLPVETLRQVIARWLSSIAELRRHGVRPIAAAVDGKAIRGGGAHALNIFAHDLWQLLDQFEVEGIKDNEMTVFRCAMEDFLARYPFVKILTFDAIFCEQKTMEALTKNNRLGIFSVKENQPETFDRLWRWFHATLPKGAPDYREAEKKRGLHRDARTVGTPRSRRHRREDPERPPSHRAPYRERATPPCSTTA